MKGVTRYEDDTVDEINTPKVSRPPKKEKTNKLIELERSKKQLELANEEINNKKTAVEKEIQLEKERILTEHLKDVLQFKEIGKILKNLKAIILHNKLLDTNFDYTDFKSEYALIMRLYTEYYEYNRTAENLLNDEEDDDSNDIGIFKYLYKTVKPICKTNKAMLAKELEILDKFVYPD